MNRFNHLFSNYVLLLIIYLYPYQQHHHYVSPTSNKENSSNNNSNSNNNLLTLIGVGSVNAIPHPFRRRTKANMATPTITPTITTTPATTTTTTTSPAATKAKTVTTNDMKINDILSKISRWQKIHSKFQENLPFVCVTYAQTLDGMIAVKKQTFDNDIDSVNENDNDDSNKNRVSSNLQLSCKESFQLTHALRSIHDGILIGGNTLRTDNPRLNNRLWPSESSSSDSSDSSSSSSSSSCKQPIPIILDTHLNSIMQMIKSKTNIKAITNHDKIIICCNEDAYKTYNEEIQSVYTCNTIQLVPCMMNDQRMEFGTGGSNSNNDDDDDDSIDDNNDNSGKQEMELKGGGLNIHHVLHKLRLEHDIKSLMAEGGSSILSSFISKTDDVVDCVCVTIVPKFIGGMYGLQALNEGCDLIQQEQQQDGEMVVKGLEFDPSSLSWSSVGSDCIFLASCV